MLPQAVRETLDRKLSTQHFSGYIELSRWLASEGHVVSKSAVHRYGAKLELRLQEFRAPRTPAQRIDAAIQREMARVEKEKIRQETGVFVLVIDPPTRETIFYASAKSAAQVQKLVEKALFGAPRDRQ